MKNLKSVRDFQSQQVDVAGLKKVKGGAMAANSEIDYGTYKGNGEYSNDTTADA